MSWQDWGDTIKRECDCPAGGIYGLDGNPWAEFGMNEVYSVTPTDILSARECITSGEPSKKPVHVGGCKHIITQAGDGSLSGKNKAKSSIVAVDCNRCIIVAIGGEGSEPRKLLFPLARVADMLKAKGY